MIRITKKERLALEEAGLLHTATKNADQNFIVANKHHSTKAKSYYVVADIPIIGCLGKYELLDLVPITQEQVNQLITAKLLRDDAIQLVGTYAKNPVIFLDRAGKYRMRKIGKFMSFLHIH